MAAISFISGPLLLIFTLYKPFLSLETNDYFGDSALDSKTTRNATIIASEDTDVGYLEMGLYNSNLGEEDSPILQVNDLIKSQELQKVKTTKIKIITFIVNKIT